MMRPRLIAAASAACLLISAIAAPAMAASPLAPRGAKVLAALDTNKDGMVDRAEFRVGQEMLFQRVDANRDGIVSREEFDAAFQRATARRAAAPKPADQGQAARPARQFDKSRLFARLDTNKDGAISHDEYLATGDRLFARCDKDGDGKVAPGDCSPRRAAQAPKQQ